MIFKKHRVSDQTSFASAKWSNRHIKLRSSVHFKGYDTKVL